MVIPPKITALMKTRVAEVRTRVTATGLGFRDGVIAADAEAMDGVLD